MPRSWPGPTRTTPARGAWPTKDSGPVGAPLGETWVTVNVALMRGTRGLPARSSLARLLARKRGVRNHAELPRLTEKQILRWADRHFRRNGEWPKRTSGPIAGAPGETWDVANTALHQGKRGLPGGSSLARLLAAQRSVRNQKALLPLTLDRILAWADAHFQRLGHWPKVRSGPVADAPGETWIAVETALDKGQRGLPGGSSLARFLAKHRGALYPMNRLRLTVAQILRWAKAHYQRTSRWPNREAGPLPEAPGETWCMINRALRKGKRGLRGGTSLGRLLRDPAMAARP
jgi:hypothetical protein